MTIDAQGNGKIGLGIGVDEQNFVPAQRQGCPQVDAGGCLANAPFKSNNGYLAHKVTSNGSSISWL